MEVDSNKRRRIDDEVVVWMRDDIICCNCLELKFRYVYCFCFKCNGVVVVCLVEYFYW